MHNDEAEQIVRISLNGAEMAAKLTGAAAKEIAVMLYAILKDQHRTKGKMRLSHMLRTGKQLKVFAVKEQDLKKFCKAAKKYGVLYTVLKDKKAKDGICDVMVRSEDASKVNRIFDRFKLSTIDRAEVKAAVVRDKKEKPPVKKDDLDTLIDKLLKEPTKEKTANPSKARTTSNPSVPFSMNSKLKSRPSVREELARIRLEQKPLAHKAPKRKRRKER